MKALITGSEGFVGKYLRKELENNGYQIVRADLIPAPDVRAIDLLDATGVSRLIEEEQPDCVFHLAAQADVGKSWKMPQMTMQLNVTAAINVMEAVRAVNGEKCRIVMVGSADQYGNLGTAGEMVHEETGMKPQSPYAVSKRAQEDMARLYVQVYGMKICMTRSFNHGGAGQRTGFMIADFAEGIVQVEKGIKRDLLVGNLTSRRDFTHVKDVVRAYRLIAEKGRPGEVYNVGSGTTWSAQEILDRMIAMAKCPIPVRQDPARMRPSDTPVICCDHGKLTRDTGWTPEITLDTILQDTIAYYRGIHHD